MQIQGKVLTAQENHVMCQLSQQNRQTSNRPTMPTLPDSYLLKCRVNWINTRPNFNETEVINVH